MKHTFLIKVALKSKLLEFKSISIDCDQKSHITFKYLEIDKNSKTKSGHWKIAKKSKTESSKMRSMYDIFREPLLRTLYTLNFDTYCKCYIL